MKVFITGGTGFIGSEVVRRLIARGDSVTAMVRDPTRCGSLAAEGVRLVAGDLSSDAALAEGIQGAAAVIHCAAIYEVGIPAARRPAMLAANVEGTERVLRLAGEAKVARIVYVSTINAFGNTEGQVVDESHQHSRRYVSYYDETKHLAHLSARAAADAGAPVVIVQPGAVYGPGDHSAVGSLINQFIAGRLPAMTFPETGLNMVHRDDVAEGILLALDRGRTGEQYVLGGEITTLRGVIEAVGALVDKKPPGMTVPAGLMKALSPLGRVIGPAMGVGPNLAEIVSASDGVTYWARDDKARGELGYSPRSLRDGLRQMLEVEGRLPSVT
ncbi:MAG: NAD-dependent epimerase/dehydratase family protein [Candidatus Dormibacteria bacterium]